VIIQVQFKSQIDVTQLSKIPFIDPSTYPQIT